VGGTGRQTRSLTFADVICSQASPQVYDQIFDLCCLHVAVTHRGPGLKERPSIQLSDSPYPSESELPCSAGLHQSVTAHGQVGRQHQGHDPHKGHCTDLLLGLVKTCQLHMAEGAPHTGRTGDLEGS
jgi:hypothetical protein